MINPSSNVSFSSRIKVVSSDEFIRQRKNLQAQGLDSVAYPWGIDQAKICKNGITTGIDCCTVLGVMNDKEKKGDSPLYLVHIDPSEENISDTRNFLPGIISSFMKNDKDSQAFIFGGDKNFPLNVDLFNQIKQVVESVRLKCSIIWGQDGTSASAMYSAKEDSWYINVFDIEGNEILTKEEFGKAFDVISISKKDSLEFPLEKDKTMFQFIKILLSKLF